MCCVRLVGIGEGFFWGETTDSRSHSTFVKDLERPHVKMMACSAWILKGQTLVFFQREVAFKQSKMTTIKAKQILPLNLSRKGSFSFDNKLGKTTSTWGGQEGRGVGRGEGGT